MRRVPTSRDTILGSQIPDRARLRRRGLFELKKTVLKIINLIVLRNFGKNHLLVDSPCNKFFLIKIVKHL
jgi:hypothetical protein